MTVLLFLCAMFDPVVRADVRVVTEEFPPFDFTGEDGRVAGLATEVVREVLAELGISPRIRVLPWARALRMAMTEPGTLLYSVVRTPEREDDFHWLGVVCEVKSHLYRLKSRDDIVAGALADLKEYSVGVVRDWAGHRYLERHGFAHLEPVAESDSNIKKLVGGRVDLIEDYEANLVFRMKQLEMDPGIVEKVHYNAEISGPLYAVFGRQTDPDLVERFRKAFSRVHNDGRYDEIQRRWHSAPQEPVGLETDLLRRWASGPFSRSFSSNSDGYSPRTIEKIDSLYRPARDDPLNPTASWARRHAWFGPGAVREVAHGGAGPSRHQADRTVLHPLSIRARSPARFRLRDPAA